MEYKCDFRRILGRPRGRSVAVTEAIGGVGGTLKVGAEADEAVDSALDVAIV